MYEDMTFNVIMDRLIDRVVAKYSDIDTREGSFMYDALAPAALELENLYQELDAFSRETYAGTASREGLTMRGAEIGIAPKEATFAEFKGNFDAEVPIGSRFNNDYFNYTVTEKVSDPTTDNQYYVYRLQCETAGSEANTLLTDLVNIDKVTGLTYAKITSCEIEGEDEEDTEDFRNRYFHAVAGDAVDGNVRQYEIWCEEFGGIGNYKVTPCWNGANTVKVSILSPSNTPASSTLVNEFQTYLDPNKEGMGNGVAPIGAVVTVDTATALPITVSFKASLADGYTYDSALTTKIQKAIQDYLASIAFVKSAVNYMSIGAAIMNLEFIEAISNLKVNDGTTDVTIGSGKVPTCTANNAITWSVITS